MQIEGQLKNISAALNYLVPSIVKNSVNPFNQLIVLHFSCNSLAKMTNLSLEKNNCSTTSTIG